MKEILEFGIVPTLPQFDAPAGLTAGLTAMITSGILTVKTCLLPTTFSFC
ncbi:MAG: hypothetical protein MUF72_21830 [Elainella sp. Prado103]|jgi:hypothetical protein|nr:hypothetical protein [Elainella sp. Prado103]